MPRKKVSVEIHSFGIYSKWERNKKELPKLIKITDRIPAEVDIEFGYVLQIKKAKGKTISFIIEHPPFKDDEGNTRPPFEGEHFINSNDFRFFLGDSVWEPVEDKKGEWRLISMIDNAVVADKSLFVE